MSFSRSLLIRCHYLIFYLCSLLSRIMVEASILPGALVLLCFGLKDDKPAFLHLRFFFTLFLHFLVSGYLWLSFSLLGLSLVCRHVLSILRSAYKS